MAGLITVRLSRSDAQPWGFRLQGGKDFGAPLLIQKVNGGSLAERAGLQVADAVIKVNGQDVYNLRHKDAQDTIVKAGNSFEVVVSRGPGGTWKPSVTPVGNVPAPSPVGGAPAPVTKTSLAYKGPASPAIGSGHNVAARPFSATPQLNGVGDQGSVKSITSKQYNNPVGLYSEQTIAETLSAQAEVLAGGVLGVNFMKNEKTYNANNSEVLKMVQEIDNEPREPEPVEPVVQPGGVSAPPPSALGLRHVVPPETKPPSTTSPQAPLQPGQNVCADCERLIVGVFVRIKDKNLHVECFKCATCGTSLKNVGYYNINNKLYCDIHAKLVARSNPPAPNLDPITIPPGGQIPSGAISAPQPSSGGVQSPQPGTLAPLPFHAPRLKPSHVNAPLTFKPQTPTSTFSGPKPFGAPAAPPAPFSTPAAPVSAPFSSVSAPAPAPAQFSAAPTQFSAAPAAPAFPSFPKNLPGQTLPKPLGKKDFQRPIDFQRPFYGFGRLFEARPYATSQPDTAKSKDWTEEISCCMDQSKRMSVCSNEVCALSEKRSAIKAMETLTENPNRASPVPFSKDAIVKEDYSSAAQEKLKTSENVNTSDEGNIQITRKTKVEESFVKSQKMYTAEISSSSQAAIHVRATSPEMEQIMAKRKIYQSYHDSSRLTPNTLQQRALQSERCLTPEIEHLMDKPHGTWSPMPAACFVRPISPKQIISYPPNIPPIPVSMPQPRTATPEQFQEARETVERFVDHTKQVNQTQTTSTGRSTQSSTYTTQQFSDQQYTPRFDANQGFSTYIGKGNPENGSSETGYSHNPGSHVDVSNHGSETSEMVTVSSNSHSNGNPNRQGNRNPVSDKGENPTVTETDEPGEQQSRKSSKADQSQKSSRKTSASEEESSRRVFSDFGGPQVSSSVEVESTTEGGVQKTSVSKSQKTAYSSCEFESTKKSSIKHDDDNVALSTECNEEEKPAESRKYSYPKFSMGESSINEETVTKSQVEEIIKQELNKVFHMAQTMEETNFGEIYNQKFQEKSSSRQTLEQIPVQVVEQPISQKYERELISAKYDSKISSTGEVIKSTGKLTSGLTIAPERPFTPQALESNFPLPYQNLPSDFPPPKSLPETPPSKPAYIPLTVYRGSPLLQALTYASDRPYSPLPNASTVETPSFLTPPQSKRSSMLEALTTAPNSSFHIKGVTIDGKKENLQNITEASYQSIQMYAPKPSHDEFKPISVGTVEPKLQTSYMSKNHSVTMKSQFKPVADELKSAFKSTSKTVSSSITECERQQTETSKQTLSSHAVNSRVERPITPSGLHPPNLLPYYQQNIGEIPLAHRSNSPVPHQIKAPSVTPPRAQSVPRQSERRGSVKAMSEAYSQQLAALNNQQQSIAGTGTVSYVSSGAFSSGSVSKAYSYEQEHKSIDPVGYQASPLAGKLPLAGEQTLPKCSSPVLGKLDHTKQVFKPSVPPQQPVNVFRSPAAEQANLRQAPPYFIQEKEKPPVPWVVLKDKASEGSVNVASFKPSQPPSTQSATQTTTKPSLPSFPNVNKTMPAFPEPPKPFSLPGVTKPPSVIPDAGPGGPQKGGSTAGTSAPRRGRGVLNTAVPTGGRIPLCGSCNNHIRGPFITALGKIWCPEHFVCVNAQCRRPLQDIGFVEDDQGLYCEFCFEQYLAPTCNKCNAKVKGDCLNAIGKHFHPECFTCAYCGKLFGNSPFFLEDALPYCEADWNELFTTKCFSCGFPIEAGDRWVEALNNNYHSQCFNCTMCKKNLEGQSFFAKGGRPFCKNHAR